MSLGLALCASGAPAALAERPAAAPAAVVQEIIVTGTRLPNSDLTSDVPTVSVSQAAIESRASLTLETVLNRLPQVVPSYSSAANNPSANGASYVNLRGLGTSRNLVLLDGRRVVGANAASSVDLNTIPEPLIQRVEIITGGASAVYGPDALAGVVNVILKTRFEGFEALGRTLVSERGDGQEHELSLSAGRALAHGSLMGSVGWSRRDEISKGARPFSAQADSVSPFLPGGAYVTTPGNLPSRAAVNAIFASYGVAPGEVSQRGGQAGFSFNSDGTLFAPGFRNNPLDVQNYRGPLDVVATRFYPDVYSYNFQPFNKLILPLDRVSAALFGTLDLPHDVHVYGQAMGVRYTADTSLAPTPAPTDANPLYPDQGVFAFTIPVSNPFIPKDLATLLASRTGNTPSLAGSGAAEDFEYRFRPLALGPRLSSNRAEVGNLLGGVRFPLWGDWRGDAYASYGRYQRTERQEGMLKVRPFEQLMYSPTGGTELCQGGLNPFGGTMSQSCRDFLRATASFSTRITQVDAVALAQGAVFSLPAGKVRAVVGAEHREASYRFTPPTGFTPGEVAGFIAFNPESGSIRSNEVFTEVAVPILADRPLAKALDLTLGYRLTSQGGNSASSWKVEGSWAPVAELRVRSSYQRAVRSPDILELYEAPVGGSTNFTVDPCALGSPQRTAQVLALCQEQAAALGFEPGFAAAFSQPFPGVDTINHGNPDLSPEAARTFTAGIVWQPSWRSDWVGDLHATLDWFDIRIDNAIDYLDPQAVLNACYNVTGQNPTYDPKSPFCAGIKRAGDDFSLLPIDAPRTNQAFVSTSGVDLAVTFRTDLAALGGQAWMGRLETSVAASWLASYKQQGSPLQPKVELAGTTADANTGYESLPRWKGLLDLAWTSGPVQLDLSGRYVSRMENQGVRLGLTPAATGPGAAWYWDLSGVFDLGKRAQLRAGVLNLFDRGPEVFTPAVDASTDPSTYDVVGRRYWIGLDVRF